MNATEIRRALQPLADFAPAVLKAAEIVEAAEAAEKRMPELTLLIAVKETELADMETQRKSMASDLTAQRKAFEAEKEQMKANAMETRKGLEESVAPLTAKVAGLRADVDTLEKQRLQKVADANKEIKELTDKRDALRRDLQAAVAKVA